MAKAIFISNPDSNYDDRPGELYHFPNRNYLSSVAKTVGDWVIFYRSRASGRGAGYYQVQRVEKIIADPQDPHSSYAVLAPESLLEFEQLVPRQRTDGRLYESTLAISGGNNASAVRMLSESDFAAILTAGLTPLIDQDALPRLGPLPSRAPEGLGMPGWPRGHCPLARPRFAQRCYQAELSAIQFSPDSSNAPIKAAAP